MNPPLACYAMVVEVLPKIRKKTGVKSVSAKNWARKDGRGLDGLPWLGRGVHVLDCHVNGSSKVFGLFHFSHKKHLIVKATKL